MMVKGKLKKPSSEITAGTSSIVTRCSVANVNKEVCRGPPLTTDSEMSKSQVPMKTTKRKLTVELKVKPQKIVTAKKGDTATPIVEKCDSPNVRSRPTVAKHREVHATFVDDQQKLDMTIDADPDDSLCCSEDGEELEDNPIEPIYPSEDESSKDEMDTETEIANPDRTPHVSLRVVRKPLTNQEKLHTLDLEMKEKIKDIHKIMSEGGLTKTVRYMNRCFGLDHDKTTSAHKSPANRSRGKKLDKNKEMNLNQNRRAQCHVAMEIGSDRSAETIYKNAVEKRNSSSSEDDCIDISDEFLHLIVDPQPGDSRDDRYDLAELRQREQVHQPREVTPEERSDQFIRDAEAAKADIFPPKGNDSNVPYHFVAQMDEDYLVVGNHRLLIEVPGPKL